MLILDNLYGAFSFNLYMFTSGPIYANDFRLLFGKYLRIL
jgi:hypothetical protein